MGGTGVLLLFALALTGAGHGAGTAKSPEWKALQKRLARDRVRVRYLVREEASILAGLEQLDRQIAEKNGRTETLSRQLDELVGRIEVIDEALAGLDDKLQGLRKKAGRRAAAVHRMRRTRLSDLITRARDPVEARRMGDRLRIVMAYDHRLLTDAREAATTQLLLRDELDGRRRALDSVRAELEVERDALVALREERAALLDAIRKERVSAARLARELKTAAKRLRIHLGKIRGRSTVPPPVPGGFNAQKGRLPWPAPGRVEVAFGKMVEPRSSMVMVHKGMDIRAPLSTPVRAIYEGTVVFASWFEGFGRLLVLEHPEDYYSVYAHLESFQVGQGQRVQQHQVVGIVGDSGSTKGPYLYFELRRGKVPLDPLKWLAP